MRSESLDGVAIATKGPGGDEPAVLFVHATGFCKETWDPTISRMETQPLAWRSMDLRGHGDSDAGPFPQSWTTFGEDVLKAVGDNSGLVGVGHSCGGASLVRAEATMPGTFRHLVLVEPIIFPPPHERIDIPLAEGARRRRKVFESRDAAYERFAGGPFASWHPEALAAYVDHGFSSTNEGWSLKCDPQVEADFFMEGNSHDTWEQAATIRSHVTLVAGERSDTHREPYLSMLANRFSSVDLVVLPDTGHLIPMEDPHGMARIVDNILRA